MTEPIPFVPVPNYCEENVWMLANLPSQNERWAVFVVSENRRCQMHAQVAQYPSAEAVIWDYHVVLLDRTPDGDVIYDDSYTGDFPGCAIKWTQENFPVDDDLLRFRVVDASEYVRDFRSDRRNMQDPSRQPPWPAISPGEYNLTTFLSATEPGPGRLLNLAEWRAEIIR